MQTVIIGILVIVIPMAAYFIGTMTVSYTHLRAHETGRNLVCRLLLEKKKKKNTKPGMISYALRNLQNK